MVIALESKLIRPCSHNSVCILIIVELLAMSFRSLGGFEKKILSQSLEGHRNGVVFGAMYSTTPEEWSDDATLLTYKDSRLNLSLLSRTLAKMISDHVELFTTINEKLEFAPVKEIKAEEVINAVTFGSYKDEFVNCRFGAPPYLLRHIFNQTTFQPGSGNVLWQIYVVDETLVVFHGHDVLFDIFSAANFHKIFLQTLNSISKSGSKLSTIFKLEKAVLPPFPKSIYDNAKLRLPAKAADLFNLQTQSFFKSLYFNAVKKPLDYINSNPPQQLKEYRTRYADILRTDNNLCGTTIFGRILPKRLESLDCIFKQQNICLKSFVCGITMLCLKPIVKNYTGSITFCVPVDLRSSLEASSEFGMFYKDIRVECPLSLIDDKNFNSLTVYNGYDSSAVKMPEKDPGYKEQLLEYQFKQVTDHVVAALRQRMKAWEKFGFNDDDIKRMKFGSDDTATNTKLIQINDVSDIPVDAHEDISGKFHMRELNMTQSLKPGQLMSLSYTHSEKGLDICIHYPDGYNMESFVECFQSFIEDA